MARYTGPKFRLDRREGVNLFLKGTRSSSGKHPLDKKGAIAPGVHGQKGLHRKVSEYGVQLREKQKVKRTYGLLEKQFKNYFVKAAQKKGATGVILLQTLESRLDNVVFRLGFAVSRNQARQLVTHGHVRIGDSKVNIPSYQVGINQIVTLKERIAGLNLVEEQEANLSPWLEKKGLSGKMIRLPEREELDPAINEQLIVEYYSR